MPKSNPKQNQKLMDTAALKIIADREKVKDLIVAHWAEDVVPSTGKKIYRCSAIQPAEPNGPQYVVVLDEQQAVVNDLDNISKQEGKRFFSPTKFDIDQHSLAPLLPPPSPITIAPTAINLFLNQNDISDQVLTVTVPKSTIVSKADVYFLADTTGSMGGFIQAVKDGANNILNVLTTQFPDMAFGVGSYSDFPADPEPFKNQLPPTTNKSAVADAINQWAAAGGGDLPEAQFFALEQIAQLPEGPNGWRPNSKRIIVWFGDAPGHDPICSAIRGTGPSAGLDITEASVTESLTKKGITVLAISTITNVSLNPKGLDGNPSQGVNDYVPLCTAGGAEDQATRIAAATFGRHITEIKTDEIVETIIDLVTDAVTTIGAVSLQASGNAAQFVTSITARPRPAAALSAVALEQFIFDVRLKGVVPCDNRKVFLGDINVLIDGAVVTTPRTAVTVAVPACLPTFDPELCCDEITNALSSIQQVGLTQAVNLSNIEKAVNGLGNSIKDISSFIPTKTESAGGGFIGGVDGSGGPRKVRMVIANVLGRPPGGDPRTFLAALTAAFPEKDGQIVLEPVRTTVSTEAKQGLLAAEQATLFHANQIIINDALKILDGLQSISFSTDKERALALTEMVRSEFKALVDETSRVDRPRKSKIDEILAQLPGHLSDLSTVLGFRGQDSLTNSYLVTTQEAQMLASMNLLKQYATTLKSSFANFFATGTGQDPRNGSFSGRLAFVSLLFSVIATSVREVEADMDAVEFSEAERRTAFIVDPSNPGPPPVFISVDGILSWVKSVAEEEGPDLIAKSGLIGLNRVIRIVKDNLVKLVAELLKISRGQSQDIPHIGLTHSRVENALEQLHNQLKQIT